MSSAERSVFGHHEGRAVMATTLTNRSGMQVEVIDYGAIVRRVLAPALGGGHVDLVVGFDDLQAYLSCGAFVGATVGRVANRIGNSRFELNGRTFELYPNDPPHHLHGGKRGYDRVFWDSTAGTSEAGAWVKLTYLSPAGEEGYPGAVQVSVTYTLTENNELNVDMNAVTTETTPLSLAHHSYWTLGGHDAGTLEDQTLQVFADEYTPGFPVVPNGTVAPVAGTPFDLREPRKLTQLREMPGSPAGFDHNFVVRGPEREFRPVAEVCHLPSGRRMSVLANQPGAQIYTGNFMDGSMVGKGARYPQYSALCIETQAFPNSINVPAWKHQILLNPGETYHHRMTHRFSL
jgi:aldose 1-epimerase